MNTTHILDQLWEEYSAKRYPDGVSGIKALECKQAFAAGMVAALEMVAIIGDDPDGEADATIADKN